MLKFGYALYRIIGNPGVLDYYRDKLYTLKTQSTVMGILQVIIEQILKRHVISPSAESYYLKLRMPSHDDFLVIGRVSEQILAGFQNKGLISNPVLAFDYNQGNWFPVRIEQPLGVTVCSSIEEGNRMIIPYRLRKFMLFQKMLANKIMEQKWLQNGEKVE